MRGPLKRSHEATEQAALEASRGGTRAASSWRNFLVWLGPALMVSIAYMDPGNYGTDIAAGAGFKYDLLWAGWLASGMAMLLQYLSGKLGVASGYSLPELVRLSLVKRRYVIPYWLAAEVAAAATDLAEYLGTVIGLNLLFGVPLLYASIFGALDVIVLLAMMGRRFRIIEQYFALLISVLVLGILYNLVVVGPDLSQVAFHSIVPLIPSNDALLIAVGMVGATVMPHALFVHSWLAKNKMDLLGKKIVRTSDSPETLSTAITDSMNPMADRHPFTSQEIEKTRRVHLVETVVCLIVAAVVNAGILLVAIPLYPNVGITIDGFVAGIGKLFGPIVGIVFVFTLLASGLSASALGTIAGQVIMEGLIGKRWNVWVRRIVTRGINVFPVTAAILLGFDPLSLLIYSQVVLSLLIPLPMIPLVYYTSKRKFMGAFVNRRSTTVLALTTILVILAFNGLLIYSTFVP